MKHLQLNQLALTDAETNALRGQKLSWRHYKLAPISEDTAVYDPDSNLVGVLIKGAVPAPMLAEVLPYLNSVSSDLSNRASVVRAGSQMPRVRTDGMPSMRQTVPKEVLVAHGGKGDQLGFMEERHGAVCRLTRWTVKHPEVMQACLPLIVQVDHVYRSVVRTAHSRQMLKVEQIQPELRIGQTAFTTVTVNKNNRTAAHKDSGDVRDGLGCLTTHGDFSGGYFIMPKFGVAFDVRPGDLLLANVHEMHGNGEMQGERISCVYYARERMHLCPKVAA